MSDYDNGYVESLDEYERNARSGSQDHRGPNRPRGPMGMVPYGNRRPGRRPRPGSGGSSPAREVVIYQEPPAQPRTGLFANLTTDEVVELAAQAFAAFQAIPAAPTARSRCTRSGTSRSA
jgi:hypothetical protein